MKFIITKYFQLDGTHGSSLKFRSLKNDMKRKKIINLKKELSVINYHTQGLNVRDFHVRLPTNYGTLEQL